MPAPTPTARGVPAGKKFDEGYKTLICFKATPTLGLWEKVVQPIGIDGLEAIDTTTMHNTTYRTKAPRSLKEPTAGSMTVAYDPAALPNILTQINKEDTITEHYPNGSSLCYYGFLQSFVRTEHREDAQPEATCTITPTFQDPTDGTEQPWVFTPPVP